MLPLGTRLVLGLHKSNRIASRLNVQVNRFAVNKAIAKYGNLAKEAITKELQQILDKRVLEFVLRSKFEGRKQLSSVIRSSMFLKEKLDLGYSQNLKKLGWLLEVMGKTNPYSSIYVFLLCQERR
jgi:hypothetical protein